MDETLRAAVDKDDRERISSLILERQAASRAQVGLAPDSSLDALQLAALYDAEAAERMLARGVRCDIHSASALGRTHDIRSAVGPAAFASLAEWLTPMGVAIVCGRPASVRCLLDAGDDPDRTLSRVGFFVWEVQAMESGEGSWTPLHAAAVHGYFDTAPETVRLLVERGADLSRTCPLGMRPVHLAAIYGWMTVIETLLDLGEEVDVPTVGVSQRVRELCALPEHAEALCGQTPLMIATQEGATDAVRLFLDRGAAVNASDSNGSTPLHLAARPLWKENAGLVSLLLERGADPSRVDARGRKPRELAAAAGFEDTVQIFARSG